MRSDGNIFDFDYINQNRRQYMNAEMDQPETNKNLDTSINFNVEMITSEYDIALERNRSCIRTNIKQRSAKRKLTAEFKTYS